MFDTIFRQERAEKAYNENKDNGNPDKAEGVTPMEVGELIEKWKTNTFTAFKQEDVLRILMGCQEKTRSTFFPEAKAVTDVQPAWKTIAVRLMGYAISQTGNNRYSTADGIRGMTYDTSVGQFFEENPALWTDIWNRYMTWIGAATDQAFLDSFFQETTEKNFIMGMEMPGLTECIRLCFALVRLRDASRFESYCKAWEAVIGEENVRAYKAENTLSEYAHSAVLKDEIMGYVQNAVNAVTNQNNWEKQEKRDRGVAAATRGDILVVHEVRMAYHHEYDQGEAVKQWLTAVGDEFSGLKVPDCHVHEITYSAWTDAPSKGGCVTGDTLISLADGTAVPITQIQEGTQVLSAGNTVSVTSDERIVNRRISCLYGINDREPFLSFEHAVLTEEGWKSLDPQTTNSINDFYHATQLQVGDVVITLQGKEVVENIPRVYADLGKGEYFVGYDLHFRQGDSSYFANGLLVLLNYPQITLARVRRAWDAMTPEQQHRCREMIRANEDLFCDIFGSLSIEQLKKEILK